MQERRVDGPPFPAAVPRGKGRPHRWMVVDLVEGSRCVTSGSPWALRCHIRFRPAGASSPRRPVRPYFKVKLKELPTAWADTFSVPAFRPVVVKVFTAFTCAVLVCDRL